MAPPAADGAPKGTARRDKLHELEEKAQAKWDKANAFEVDAPEGKWDGGKFMATFPYPYMNGLLHIGHGFSCSKAEFAVAFQRLLFGSAARAACAVWARGKQGADLYGGGRCCSWYGRWWPRAGGAGLCARSAGCCVGSAV